MVTTWSMILILNYGSRVSQSVTNFETRELCESALVTMLPAADIRFLDHRRFNNFNGSSERGYCVQTGGTPAVVSEGHIEMEDK